MHSTKKIFLITAILFFITILSIQAENERRSFSPPRISETPVKNKIQSKKQRKKSWTPPAENQPKQENEKTKQKNKTTQKKTRGLAEKHNFYMQRLNREIMNIKSFHDKILSGLKNFANSVIDSSNLRETRKTLASTLKQSKLFSAVFLAYSPRAATKKLVHYMIWFIKQRNKIVRLYPDYKRYNYLKMKWFLRPLRTGKIYYTKPYRENGKLMISAVIPVIKNGQKIAALGADIHFSRLAGKIAGMRFGRKGFTFLASEDGTIIAHPNEKYIGKKNLFKFKAAQTLFNTGTPDSRIYALARVMLKKRKKGKTLIVDTYSGDKYFAYFGPVIRTPWALCIMIKTN